ncbi:MAG: hypothetical protein NUV50_11220 [Rhodospirillales bacterium]|nr:hypothetical protein [Rhodospirillales bacterium]
MSMPNGFARPCMIKRRLVLSALSAILNMVVAALPAGAADIKMNVVEYCPEQPYELWYPFNKTGMFLDGKMNLTRDSISFDRHGSFKYTVRTSPEGYTYLELQGLPKKHKLSTYVYLRYSKSPFTYANHSCMLHFINCTTREGMEELIRMENKLPNNGGKNAYCDLSSSVRNSDRGRMVGLIPPDIYE